AFLDRAAAERVIEHLLRGRLLISSQRDGQAWLELAHDSLAQRWDRLRAWQVEDAGRRRFHESVSQAALLWSERGRAGSLLWSGETLDEAVRWRRGFTGAVGAR